MMPYHSTDNPLPERIITLCVQAEVQENVKYGVDLLWISIISVVRQQYHQVIG
jgi:hypothetical protein